nr:keratin, type I cytoskeletal 9-like [Aegilops tauschii subsp. strangulata]
MTASWASGGGGGCSEKSGGDRKLGRTLGPGSRWGGFSGTGGSGGGSSGTRDGGFLGGGGSGEPTARVSSVLHFGGKKETPGGRVRIDADKFGSAFLGCGFEDGITSDYVEWVDGEWDSKAKSVIKYLAMKNKKLETKITEYEAEIKRNENPTKPYRLHNLYAYI